MKSSKIAVVVEDNEPTRKLICTALGSIGIIDVITAENGQKAIDALANSKADIAIIDWQMDVMDGIEFTKRVRDSHAGIDPKTPILMLTGVIGPAAEREAYEAGVDLFMNKPFSIKLLYAGLQKLISLRD
jgi:two-component system chemotaxis response regulator CheY